MADDHQAAQSIGIPLNRIWVIVWSVAGFVALVAGMIWGSKLGVQFSLSLVALKALPVVILGGLTSVPGAIIGGLIIGVGEKLSEVYIGPAFGGGIEIWFAYVLALIFLLVRPQGLFGEKIIDRVCNNQCSTAKTVSSRPATAPTSRSSRSRRTAVLILGLAGVRVRRWCRFRRSEYLFRAILIPFLILSLAALGLNILVGYCGQISLGTGGFMAVGAYAAYNFLVRIDGMPLILAILLGGVWPPGGCAVRHSRPAHQGAVPGGGHVGGAVLHRLGVLAHQVVHQQFVVGLGRRCPS